jgi:hypothetical protein
MTTESQAEVQTHMIGVPNKYFKTMAVQDYANWRQALAREFLQNSSDASSTSVKFDFDMEARTLTVTDDGCGMDKDVVLTKLLVLGGSQKPEGSVGGFGKAKELLFFSWEKYEIRTQNILVKGQGAFFSIEEVPSTWRGTQCKVWFDGSEDLNWLRYETESQLKSNQTKCEVFLDGEPVSPLRRGRLVRELDYNKTQDSSVPFAKIHLNKSEEDSQVYIRLRGITMFRKHLWEKKNGRIIIELQGESVDLLTSNRDSLKYDAQRELDKIINELVMNCNTALKEKPIKIERYEGEGLVKMPINVQIKKSIEQITKAMEQTTKDVEQANTAKEINDIIQSSNRFKHFFSGNLEKIEKTVEQKGLEAAKEEIKVKLRALNYKPDFIVKRKEKLPKALNPESWTSANLKLAVMWEAVVKRVLLDAEKSMQFAIGWTSDEEDLMSETHKLEDGSVSFLINPFNPNLRTKNFNFLVGELVDLALREVTKLDHPVHNETFFDGYQKLRRACRLTDFAGIIREAIRAI